MGSNVKDKRRGATRKRETAEDLNALRVNLLVEGVRREASSLASRVPRQGLSEENLCDPIDQEFVDKLRRTRKKDLSRLLENLESPSAWSAVLQRHREETAVLRDVLGYLTEAWNALLADKNLWSMSRDFDLEEDFGEESAR